MQIGPYTITAIEAGEFALDGGAMFGIVPKPLWEKKIGVDARNRIDMRLRCLLIRGEIGGKKRTILVDTGMGTKWDAKGIDIYRIDYSRYDLLRSLAGAGIQPTDVTDVILTHCHFDHAGGATTAAGEGQIAPSFPKATYYVQQAHWEWAQHPSDKDWGSFMAHDFLPLMEAKQLTLLAGTDEIFPGIGFRLTNGHTAALQHPLITDGTTTLFYCADLLPTSLHVGIPWIMAYDIRPLETLAEKKAVLADAARNRWILAFEHCPLVAAARVEPTEKGYRIADVVAL
ncbi:MAG: MBL fold metallo-hydrolase [Deltaproteobacteria bacterium]|nr:MBL fold metallo-hydrolase [Deltaproteobacteria bacterium]